MTNWQKFWDEKAQNNNSLAQVARIQSGKFHSEKMIDQIAHRIIEQLDLQQSDSLLDLCCGNGLLTSKLALHCKNIDAVDLSKNQIEIALKNNNLENIIFVNANASEINLNKKYDKILLYFSFQYFDTYNKGFELIENIKSHLNSNGVALLGDIPDRSRINIFYKTPISRLKYHIKNIINMSDMGKFWSTEELNSICDKLNIRGEYIQQENWQPYANYRFDYLIKKS